MRAPSRRTLRLPMRKWIGSMLGADPGEKLDWSQAPKLRKLLEEVAARVATRPVDNVYLTPGTDLAVFERGGFLERLSTGAALPLHRPGAQLGRPPSAALPGPSAPALLPQQAFNPSYAPRR